MDWFGDTFFIISTHAPLAGRDEFRFRNDSRLYISTHAPLAGRDWRGSAMVACHSLFQPTRPLRGATSNSSDKDKDNKFQPTRPLRGATALICRQVINNGNFNPRAPCGARQQKCTNHYAHFCDNRQISDAFAQNAACQGILLLFDAGKPCGFWVRTAQVISARLCFAL